MKFNPHYCSHLPVLIKVLQITSGDVLELGTGVYSTPVIHWLCVPHQRHIYSFDNEPSYWNMTEKFRDEYHKIEVVDDWDKIEIERPWNVVLVDHSPGIRRKVEIARLANYAEYMIVHDTDWRSEPAYQYKEIYPLFKYRYDYNFRKPHTSILSNFVDLKDFVPC